MLFFHMMQKHAVFRKEPDSRRLCRISQFVCRLQETKFSVHTRQKTRRTCALFLVFLLQTAVEIRQKKDECMHIIQLDFLL